MKVTKKERLSTDSEVPDGALQNQAKRKLDELVGDYRDLEDQRVALKKNHTRLQAKKQKIREQILSTKQERSEIHDKLGVMEVEYHLQEQDRLQIEGLQYFATDLEALVKETKPETQCYKENNSNLEFYLTNLTTIMQSLNQFKQTKRNLLAAEKLIDERIARHQ